MGDIGAAVASSCSRAVSPAATGTRNVSCHAPSSASACSSTDPLVLQTHSAEYEYVAI
jgi:hypothetical protein